MLLFRSKYGLYVMLFITISTVSASIIFGQTTYSRFTPGQKWLADDGKHINAHACGIYFENGTYYWFGECRPGKGVSCYSSTDLYNWKNLGLVFKPEGSGDVQQGCVMERPKVIKCEKTGKYVMWFHLELAGQGYSAALAATCVADKVTGPYKFVRSFRPNGNMSRDQTIFLDDDGTAYHFYSSRDNYDMRVHTMTDDFLDATTKDMMIFEKSAHREAPAIFKYKNKYYLITSGCTGWDPNAARYDVSTEIFKQPWTTKGNPCTGPNAGITFKGQSTFVLKVQGYDNAFIFIADIWNQNDLASSLYIWLPITIKSNGDIEIPWRDSWDLSIFGPKTATLRREDFRIVETASPEGGYLTKTATEFDISGRLISCYAPCRISVPLVVRGHGQQRRSSVRIGLRR